MKNNKLIYVEGIIGAGKTTYVNSKKDCVIIKEPVEENPYLEDFYENMQEYAYKMQEWLLDYKVKILDKYLNLYTNATILVDRSILGDSCFASMLNKDGFISDIQYESYLDKYFHYIEILPQPNEVIFIDTSVDVAYDRIHNVRKRECEKNITKEYLERLQKEYYRIMDDRWKMLTT